MADKKIVDLQEISTVAGDTSFLVIDDGTQTYKIKPINIPGLPRTEIVDLEIEMNSGSNPAGFVLTFARGQAYADKNDVWTLRFTISITFTSMAFTENYVGIAGIAWAEAANQYIGGHVAGSGVNVPLGCSAVIGSTSGLINCFAPSGPTVTQLYLHGECELAEIPAWADAAMFRAEGFGFRDAGVVTSVNGQEGDVVLTTSDIPEGSRPYFSDARAKTAVVDNAITPGVTDKAPSESAVSTALGLKQSTSAKNANNGYAGLDPSGKIPTSLLPITILGALTYKGSWDASLGYYPSSPSQGWYYIVSTAGTISGVTYNLKDWMVYNGASWDKIGATDSVESVNGQQGAVSLDSDDIPEGTTNKYFTDDLARGAAVENAINDGVTNKAPSQNAVFDSIANVLTIKQSLSDKGLANGYAGLDADGLVPVANLPVVSPLTTKGDLFGYSTLGARIPVGTNGQVLEADSTAGVGVAWKSRAKGPVPVPVTTTGISVAGTIEELDASGGAFTRTAPALPTTGQDPITITYVDKNTASPTNKISIKPNAADTFDLPGYTTGDWVDFNYPGSWMTITAAYPDTKWTVQRGANTSYVPDAGRWTPTITNGANIASSSSASCLYSRVGNVVTCSGYVTAGPTSAGGTASVFEMSLPISTNMTSSNDLAGSGSKAEASGTQYPSIAIYGNQTTDRAIFSFNAASSTSNSVHFCFQYEVK